MDLKKLPVFYSFLNKKTYAESATDKQIIYAEAIKGYSSSFTICYSSDKPISKLLKR